MPDPQIRFCTSADGTRIAYTICGSGAPLLYVPHISVGMHAVFAWPEARAHFDALAARTTLVTFDRRGTGESARGTDDLSLESQTRDIAAVADAAGFDRFTLYAEISALACCVAYATRYHARVHRLVLCPAGLASPGDWAHMFRQDWSSARRFIASAAYPDGPVSLQRAYNRAMKDTLSAETAARYMETLAEVDYDALLPAVTVPTLVLSRQRIPTMRENAVRFARLLPNSELRFVSGSVGLPFPGHEAIVEAIFEFMGLGRAQIGQARFATVLFTDLVNHTEMMQRLGDAKGREVLRDHERITREALSAHGGTEVKTDGDSFMASFASVSGAVECAVALQRAFARYSESNDEPIVVRIGLNAGEPIEEDGDFFGSAVILGARIKDQAGGGEILVPEAVRHMLSGKGFVFADRGEFALKGFEDAVRLYEVRWRNERLAE